MNHREHGDALWFLTCVELPKILRISLGLSRFVFFAFSFALFVALRQGIFLWIVLI